MSTSGTNIDVPVTQGGWPDGPIGRRNVVWGWVTIVCGAISGSVIMAWSFSGPFSPPPGWDDYVSLSRRLMRLAHVAFFMLPLINIVLGKELDQIALSDRWKNITSWCAIVGMIGIPVGLMLAAIIHPDLKYIASLPVSLLLLSLTLMAVGKVRSTRT